MFNLHSLVITRVVLYLVACNVVNVNASFKRTPNLKLNRRATTCNGHAEACYLSHLSSVALTPFQLCSRSYDNVSYVGAHDSFAVGSTNRGCSSYIPIHFLTSQRAVAANQDYDGELTSE